MWETRAQREALLDGAAQWLAHTGQSFSSFAKAGGFSRDTVSSWLRAARFISPASAARLFEALPLEAQALVHSASLLPVAFSAEQVAVLRQQVQFASQLFETLRVCRIPAKLNVQNKVSVLFETEYLRCVEFEFDATIPRRVRVFSYKPSNDALGNDMLVLHALFCWTNSDNCRRKVRTCCKALIEMDAPKAQVDYQLAAVARSAKRDMYKIHGTIA